MKTIKLPNKNGNNFIEMEELEKRILKLSLEENLECIGINWYKKKVVEIKKYFYHINLFSSWAKSQYKKNKGMLPYGYSIGEKKGERTERLSFRMKNGWDDEKEVIRKEIDNWNFVDKNVTIIKEMIQRGLKTKKDPVVQVGLKKGENKIKIYFTLRRFRSGEDCCGRILKFDATKTFFDNLMKQYNENINMKKWNIFVQDFERVGYGASFLALEIDTENNVQIKIYFELKKYSENSKKHLQSMRIVLKKYNLEYSYGSHLLLLEKKFYLRGMAFYIVPEMMFQQIQYYYAPLDD